MIKKHLVPLLLFALSLLGVLGSLSAQIPRVIFDSDMSSDWDDVGDIAVLHGLASMGECQIIGMAVSSQNGGTALCMDAINTYYGKPNIPIGVRPDVGGIGGYPGQIASEFPHGPEQTPQDFPLAANLYRQLLASSPDNSVIIVTTGYLNNLKALLQSGPDQYSSLNGIDLTRQKVKVLACAGGWYPSGSEFNFVVERDAAAYVVNNWPAGAMYTGFELGAQIRTAGRLPETSTSNPIRRVYVDIEHHYPYASWGQIAIYQVIRPNENLWGTVNTGRNNVNPDGSNVWTATPDPTGLQDQAYLLEKTRYAVQEGIDALINLPPNNGAAAKPGWPSDLRATVVGSNRIDLQWTDNSFNESGFVIERRANGVYSQIASVGANVTTYSDTGLTATADTSYRVKSFNASGDSSWTYVWVYSGWTEFNFATPGDLPLYTYYQYSNLRSNRPAMPDHVSLNNDSTHGQNLTINVDVGTLGAQGNFYVYFFYQDANNWYRLNVGETSCKFEKRIAGTISQIGASGTYTNIGDGSGLDHWQIDVTSAGSLKFTRQMPYASADEMQYHIVGTLLNVTDSLSFSTGRIGLGSWARTPVWQNFNFSTSGGAPTVPVPPSGLTATAGSGQVNLNWTASAGAASYNVYRGSAAGSESTTPIATGLAGTSYSNTGLSNGTTYYYKVAAVNSVGTSGYSNEASATPSALPAAPTGLTAVAGNGQVNLSWTASSGAASYNVYRGTSSGGESSTPFVTGVTGTTYTNTGLSNGTAYYYKVAAVNGLGTSGYSNEANATPSAGGGGGGQLTGTVIGTSGSYGGSSSTADKVFDGNLATYFDAPVGNGAWAGLDLGTAQVITQIAYCPRATWSGRMVGGMFQGANAADFSGAVTLYTVAAAPPDGILTTQPISNSTAFRYVRYLSPDNGWCNVAEVAFYAGGGGGGSTPAAPTGLAATAGNAQVSLTWTASSGAASYNVYRGTAVNGESATPIATGITGVTYANTGLTNGTAYYYKVAAVNSSGVSGYSNEAGATPTAGGGGGGGQLAGSVLGTAGSYGGSSSTVDKVFDGSLATYFDAPVGSGAWAGLDLGSAQVITRIDYCPRATWAARMVGGVFQGASISDFSDAVTLLTVGAAPADGVMTSQTVSNSTAFRYVRYLSPANGWCNVAEVAFYGSGGGGGSAPAAPTGLSATAGNAQVTLSWTASSGAASYSVYRGTAANGESASPVATGLTGTGYTDAGLTNGSAYYYKIKAVNSVGSSGYSNEANATPSSGGGGGGSASFANASFETPSLSGYSYTPTGSSWTFTNNAGIQHNGSAYSGTDPVAPDGTQTAFVQGIGSTLGTMSQSVNFPAGTYTIKFYAARRWGTVQPVRVSVDGTPLGTYTPSSGSFELLTTASFTVAAGSHTIAFAATDNSSDRTSFIDLVSIQ